MKTLLAVISGRVVCGGAIAGRQSGAAIAC